jgi:hypothetical protein
VIRRWRVNRCVRVFRKRYPDLPFKVFIEGNCIILAKDRIEIEDLYFGAGIFYDYKIDIGSATIGNYVSIYRILLKGLRQTISLRLDGKL